MPDGRKHKGTLHVVYDAECALCTRAVRQLAAVRGARAELRFVPLQALTGTEADGVRGPADQPQTDRPDQPDLTRLDPGALRAQLHVVQSDGSVFAGAEAVVRIMRELPGWRLLSWLYHVPGLRGIADLAYRHVAKRRYDWFGKADDGCAGGSCALPRSADGTATSRPGSSSTREMEGR